MKMLLSRKGVIFFYNLDIDMKIILLNLNIDKLRKMW